MYRPHVTVIPRPATGEERLARDMSTALWTVMALRAETGAWPKTGVVAQRLGWTVRDTGLPDLTRVLRALDALDELVRRTRSGTVAPRDAKTEASLMAWSAAHGRPVPATTRPPRRRH